MSWKFVVAAVLIPGILSVAVVGTQAAEYGMTSHATPVAMKHRRSHRMSYGTGYRGRGTATGGPAGGLPSKN